MTRWGDVNRARKLSGNWVKKYLARTPAEMKDTRIIFDELTVNLGRMEAAVGNYSDAINWLKTAQTVSPSILPLCRNRSMTSRKSCPPRTEMELRFVFRGAL